MIELQLIQKIFKYHPQRCDSINEVEKKKSFNRNKRQENVSVLKKRNKEISRKQISRKVSVRDEEKSLPPATAC